MLVLCFAFSGAGFPEQQVTKAIFNHPASRAQDSFLHTKAEGRYGPDGVVRAGTGRYGCESTAYGALRGSSNFPRRGPLAVIAPRVPSTEHKIQHFASHATDHTDRFK